MLTNPRGKPKSDQCRQWAKDLAAAGVRVFVLEIADYEVRRKLIHIRAIAGIRRLDQVKATLDYAPITTDVMLRAAELWAAARSAGLPTAGPDALDGDCILAAQALLSVGPSDTVTVATDNVAHLSRFIDAQQSIPTTGLSPASPTAFWAAELGLTSRSPLEGAVIRALVHLVQVLLEITLLIGVPTDLTVNQSGRAQAAPSNPTASTEPVCLRVQLLSGNRIHAGNGRAFSTTPLSCGSRLATMAYGLLLVIESWQLYVSSVTQVLTVLSVATLDSMHVLPIPAEA